MVNDNVTCFICKKHLQKLDQEKNKEDAFLRTGFRNWKKALTSFSDHQQSKCHLAALTFEVTVPHCLNCYCYCKLVRRIKRQQKKYVWKVHRKRLAE